MAVMTPHSNAGKNEYSLSLIQIKLKLKVTKGKWHSLLLVVKTHIDSPRQWIQSDSR